MLCIDDIFYFIVGCLLFEYVLVLIFEGYKIGFVGLNGVGKIMLFKLIWGEFGFDGGEISLFSCVCIGGVW